MNKKIFYWVAILVVCSLPLLFGIFHPGLFVSDDGHWMVIRLSAFYEALSSGQFPVRFLPRLNQGIGYPVADFLYPLFLYVGSFLHVLKVPFLLDVKIIFAASFIFSGIGMFFFLRRYFGSLSALLGGLVYMYTPYHLYDLYHRGSLGEVVSLAIVPFVFWTIEKKSWITASLLIGLLILAHNTLALFFLPIMLLYAFIRKVPILTIGFMTLLGLGVSMFFWFPALYDKQFTIFDTVAVANPFAYFVNTISLSLVGWITLAILGGVLFVKNFLKEKLVIFFFCLGLLSLFFSFSISTIFWHSKFLAEFVQFPFRFLSITILAESFLGAYVAEHFKNKFITAFLLLLLGISCFPFLLPKQYDLHEESYYTTNVATTTVQNEYMPIWVKSLPNTYAYQKIRITDKQGSVSNMLLKGTRLSFTVNMKQNATVAAAFAYYPGWQVKVDGRSVAISPTNPDGLIQFALPTGMHTVAIAYKETIPNLFADIISFVSLVGVVVLIYLKRKNGK